MYTEGVFRNDKKQKAQRGSRTGDVDKNIPPSGPTRQAYILLYYETRGGLSSPGCPVAAPLGQPTCS